MLKFHLNQLSGLLGRNSHQQLPEIRSLCSNRGYFASIGAIAILSLTACGSVTRYDTGAIVLDIADPHAFSVSENTPDEFENSLQALKNNDLSAAEARLDESLDQEPKDPNSLLAMGMVMERTGRFDAATDYYRSAAHYGMATHDRVSPSNGNRIIVWETALKQLAKLKQ